MDCYQCTTKLRPSIRLLKKRRSTNREVAMQKLMGKRTLGVTALRRQEPQRRDASRKLGKRINVIVRTCIENTPINDTKLFPLVGRFVCRRIIIAKNCQNLSSPEMLAFYRNSNSTSIRKWREISDRWGTYCNTAKTKIQWFFFLNATSGPP